MDLAAQLAEADRLRALDFPARQLRTPAGGLLTGVDSGPGYHLADLAVSEDFWEDDGSRREQVREDREAACQALAGLLAARWGDPETLDLYPCLVRLGGGGSVPPPLDVLCGFVPEVYGWRVGDRWTGLGVGQGDRELPFQLVPAIGGRDAVPSTP